MFALIQWRFRCAVNVHGASGVSGDTGGSHDEDLLRRPTRRSCYSLLDNCLSASLLAQRADRAVISGVVTDPQGAALPGATVTIHNQATGVDTLLITNAAGA